MTPTRLGNKHCQVNLLIKFSKQINKHIAKVDGIPIFGAMWTCMMSRYIRAQNLTLTKSHEERLGSLHSIAHSLKLYGYDPPRIVYSDDPLKVQFMHTFSQGPHIYLIWQDHHLFMAAMPELFDNLTPMAAAHGLKEISIPTHHRILVLDQALLIENVFSSYMDLLDRDSSLSIFWACDAEWSLSRTVGISWLTMSPIDSSNCIYLIPVSYLHTINQITI